MNEGLRLARTDDIPALEMLIEESVRTLQTNDYSIAQMDGALGSVFGVDRQLIHDGTYFIVAQDKALVACGGWSKRESLFGCDAARTRADRLLDPLRHAARIRAFFVHPEHARQGLAGVILSECENAIRAARFRTIELVATLSGIAFYQAHGYQDAERYEVQLANGLSLPVMRMTKSLGPSNESTPA